MSKLNVGDKVFLKESSSWAGTYSRDPDSNNPIGVSGIVYNADAEGTYSVEWSNGETNGCYRFPEDLELADEPLPVDDLVKRKGDMFVPKSTYHTTLQARQVKGLSQIKLCVGEAQVTIPRKIAIEFAAAILAAAGEQEKPDNGK